MFVYLCLYENVIKNHKAEAPAYIYQVNVNLQIVEAFVTLGVSYRIMEYC